MAPICFDVHNTFHWNGTGAEVPHPQRIGEKKHIYSFILLGKKCSSSALNRAARIIVILKSIYSSLTAG